MVERLTDTDMDLRPIGAGKPIVPHIRKDSKDSEVAAELAPAPGDVFVPEEPLELVLRDQSRIAIARARPRHHRDRGRLDRCRHRRHGLCGARHGPRHRGGARRLLFDARRQQRVLHGAGVPAHGPRDDGRRGREADEAPDGRKAIGRQHRTRERQHDNRRTPHRHHDRGHHLRQRHAGVPGLSDRRRAASRPSS